MSLLSVPAVATAAAWVLKPVMVPRLKPELRFAEIPGRTAAVRVPTRHGDVACTVYLPAASGSGRPAVYVNIHGGGYVIAHPEQDDPWCRFLAARAGVAVVSVDYSVAPRHRFPVAVEQVSDVVAWAARPERDWDGRRLCVGGQSAGGGLAAGAARLALENGGPAIALQMLHYAPLDLVTPGRAKRGRTDRPVVRPWMTDIFDAAYAPDPAARRDRLVSPAWGTNAEGIAGIAPALVVTCEFDVLRDEGASYAASLAAAGALVAHHDVAGVDHGYNIMHGTREVTERMYDLIAGHVRRAVG
ncbi:alpha/beta hydrolase fold domain-containing protein [Marinitenerispora sediminis]|uniref:Carboxylesterase n=1 Tax=Marinitenerispora sediminis TaxID=1931232 RepID=A0A368T732_9ACTN|nr:alpha/beta hydrolase fold domain-containing protein [Marinitenerispora sediminis]RCV54645.1 carboxylesterase [Marinitenerispora sediminis]RCV56401.1 carboxylesterase [Marinitenerispora sediminis]RCV59745.1 carboxylesterase [Marinitenerispora sediminis]